MSCADKSYTLYPQTAGTSDLTPFPESDTNYAVTGFDVTYADLFLGYYRSGLSVSFIDVYTCPPSGDIPASAIDPPIPADFYGRKYFAMNLVMYRGDTKRFAFQVINQNDKTAIDITGWDLRFMAKWEYTDPNSEAVITKVSGDGITATSPTQGQLTVTISPSDTTAMRIDDPTQPVVPYGQPTTLYYDLQGVDLDGAIYTLVSGKLTINPEVVRAS